MCRRLDLELDQLEPLLRVLRHRQITVRLGRTRTSGKASDLGGLGERLLLGGEDGTPANPRRPSRERAADVPGRLTGRESRLVFHSRRWSSKVRKMRGRPAA
jgi:hypothetical protein